MKNIGGVLKAALFAAAVTVAFSGYAHASSGDSGGAKGESGYSSGKAGVSEPAKDEECEKKKHDSKECEKKKRKDKDDASFSGKPKNVSLKQAVEIASKELSGEVVEVEYERGSYEVKIDTGKEVRKVYVDASDGTVRRKEK